MGVDFKYPGNLGGKYAGVGDLLQGCGPGGSPLIDKCGCIQVVFPMVNFKGKRVRAPVMVILTEKGAQAIQP